MVQRVINRGTNMLIGVIFHWLLFVLLRWTLSTRKTRTQVFQWTIVIPTFTNTTLIISCFSVHPGQHNAGMTCGRVHHRCRFTSPATCLTVKPVWSIPC